MWLQLLLLLVIVVPDDTIGGTAVQSLPLGHFTQSGWNHAAWSRLQPELAQPIAQRIARDPESARRLSLVPASLAHRLLDDRFLPLPQIDPLRRQPGRGGGRGRDGRRFTRFARPGVGRAREGEVLHLECGTTTPQDGPLDHVAQLAHVPRPGVGPQQVARRSAQLAHHLPVLRVEEPYVMIRSEEHTSELQSRLHLVCRLLLEKKKNKT